MKNPQDWRPSKYVLNGGRLVASRDRREVGVPSRLITDLIAARYGRSLPTFAKGRLLDLGCGKAPLYLVYRDLVSAAICVDWSNSMHRNELLDLEWDLGQPLPYPDASYDTIVLSDVLEHIPTPDALWAEMARLLAPGGHVLINVPFYYWLHEAPFDFYRYTEFALRRFVKNCGLELVQLESIGGAPEVLGDIVSKCLFRVPRIGAGLAAATQSLTSGVLRTAFGRKVSDATRDSFPLGYFLVARMPGPQASAGI